MAIVSANYIAYRSGDSSVQGKYVVSRITRKMLVIVDDKEDDETTIATSGLIPQVYSPFPGNPFLFLKSVKIGNDYPWRGWVVTLEYDNEPFEQPPHEDNPLSEPLRVASASVQLADIAIDRDIRGLPIITKNGEPFDPPPMASIKSGTLEIVKNYPDIPLWITNAVGGVNAGNFSIGNISVQRLCGRIISVNCSDMQKRNNIQYRETRAVIEVKERPFIAPGNVLDIYDYRPTNDYGPHDLLLLHAGYRVRKERNGKIARATDGDGNPLQSPVLLDMHGVQIMSPASSADAYYLMAQVAPRVDFSAIFGV